MNKPSLLEFTRIPQAGFSLLEMLLVITLLGMLSLAAIVLTENTDSQAKYDDTKVKMAAIKRAIVGDTTRTINDEPDISGFVADVGRLPGCLRELLERVACPAVDGNPATQQASAWGFQTGAGIWAGWNGPYLNTLPESDGNLAFRDGYLNKDATALSDAHNFGWIYALSGTPQSLEVQSLGKSTADAADDYPPAGSELISTNDYLLTLNNWDRVIFQFRNPTGTAVPLNSQSLRIRLNYPVHGAFEWPSNVAARDAAEYLGPRFPDNNTPDNITVPTGNDPGDTSSAILGASGNITLLYYRIKVPAATTITTTASGNIVTFPAAGGALTVPNSSTFTDASDLLSFAPVTVPIGSRQIGSFLALPGGGVLELKSGASLSGTTVNISSITLPPTSGTKPDLIIAASPNTITVPSGSWIDTANSTLNIPVLAPPSPSTHNNAATTLTSITVVVPTSVPAGNSVFISTGLSGVAVDLPIGYRSVSIVCEGNGDGLTNGDGEATIFTGKCDENDPGTLPAPYSLTLLPRSTPPSPPTTAIPWDIHN